MKTIRAGLLAFCMMSVMSILLLPETVRGDSISPVSVSSILNVGDSVTVTKTLTVDAGTPTFASIESVGAYSVVSIDTSEAPSAIDIGLTPGSYVGSFDRSTTETFTFDVTFTALNPGTFNFNIYGTVDGGRVATETDLFEILEVVPPPTIPEPSTLLLLGTGIGLVGLGVWRRKR